MEPTAVSTPVPRLAPDASYDAVVERLFRQNEFAIKYDLEAMQRAIDVLGLERPARRVVIVAGTNGKGTASAWLHGLAHDAGQRVGLFTSPHLVDVRERMRVNGVPIAPQEFTAVVGALIRTFGDPETSHAGRALTYFELLTLAAWQWFGARDLDVAVFEVGLGGRLDATNLVDADVALITALGLDHTEYLGETLDAIAGEKAAVSRPGRPAWVHRELSGFDEAHAALTALGADVRVVDGPPGDDPISCTQALAVAAHIDALGDGAPTAPAYWHQRGAAVVRWPGRRDVREARGRTWCVDGAHNADAMHALSAWLDRRDGRGGGVDAVMAASPGRPLDAFVAPIARHLRRVHVCPASAFRSADPDALADALRRAGVADVVVHADGADAFDACSLSETGRAVLVTGSLYLVGQWFEWSGATAEDLAVVQDGSFLNRS